MKQTIVIIVLLGMAAANLFAAYAGPSAGPMADEQEKAVECATAALQKADR